MEKVKNFMIMEKYNLKENILMEEDGMVEAMIIMNIKILKLKME